MIKVAAYLMAIGIALGLTACGTAAPKSEDFTVNFSAAAALNPDIDNRPSPIQVKILTLTAIGTFSSSDFFEVFEKPDAVLGADLVNVTVVTLIPGETKSIEIVTEARAEYVGVVAGFQNIDGAQWRDHAELKGLLRTRQVKVSLDAAAIKIGE